MASNVTVNLDVNRIANNIHVKGLNGVNKIANDIMIIATPHTPKKGGQLRSRRRKDSIANGVRVSWNAKYAAVQEAGKRRGARPFSHYTTSGTGAHFADKAITAVKRKGLSRYFQ